jgi:hypothetical protein
MDSDLLETVIRGQRELRAKASSIRYTEIPIGTGHIGIVHFNGSNIGLCCRIRDDVHLVPRLRKNDAGNTGNHHQNGQNESENSFRIHSFFSSSCYAFILLPLFHSP